MDQDTVRQDPYLERMMAAREIARKIITLCNSYERSPSQMTINRFLISTERLVELAEDIEVEQTVKMLDA